MSLKIKIKAVHLMLIFIVVIGLVVGYGTKNPAQFGHTGTEVNLVLGNGSTITVQQYVSGGGNGIPAGVTMYFNGTSCPVGWSEYTTARGRYVVGLNVGGTLGGIVGTELTNSETRLTSAHRHDWIVLNELSGTRTGYLKAMTKRTINVMDISKLSSIENPGEGLDPGNVSNQLNAPYLQVLLCIKN